VGKFGEQIESHFGNGEAFGVELYYSYDGLQPLGTAGALRKALPLLGKQFFVLYGDSYLPTEFAPIAAAYASSRCPALMTVHRNCDRWVPSNVRMNHGMVELYSKAGGDGFSYVDYGLSLLRARHLRRFLRCNRQI
jgi:NDP-sugar pyrophosphorylase family protein